MVVIAEFYCTSWLKQYDASVILVLNNEFIKNDNIKNHECVKFYLSHKIEKSHIIITVSLIPEIKMHNILVYYDC